MKNWIFPVIITFLSLNATEIKENISKEKKKSYQLFKQ